MKESCFLIPSLYFFYFLFILSFFKMPSILVLALQANLLHSPNTPYKSIFPRLLRDAMLAWQHMAKREREEREEKKKKKLAALAGESMHYI